MAEKTTSATEAAANPSVLTPVLQAEEAKTKMEAVEALSRYKSSIDTASEYDDPAVITSMIDYVAFSPEKKSAFFELASKASNPYIARVLPSIENSLENERRDKQLLLNDLKAQKKHEITTKKQEDKLRHESFLKYTAQIQQNTNIPGGFTQDYATKALAELSRQYRSGEMLDVGRAMTAGTIKSESWQPMDTQEISTMIPLLVEGQDYRKVPDSTSPTGFKYEKRVVEKYQPSEYMLKKVSWRGTPEMMYDSDAKQAVLVQTVGYTDGTEEMIKLPAGNLQKIPSTVQHKSSGGGGKKSSGAKTGVGLVEAIRQAAAASKKK